MFSWFEALLRVHLACALGATAIFWVSAFSFKGGPRHRAAGRWFARLIYAAAATGGVMAIVELAAPSLVRAPNPSQSAESLALARQTMWFVLYVLLIIVTPVQHGLAVIAAGPVPSRLRSRTHAALSIASMLGTLAMLPSSLLWAQWLFLIVTPIGFIIGLRNMQWASRRLATPAEYRREHLTSLITAGITLHTAFFVFGTSRTLGLHLPGLMQLLPWVIPALVGLPLILWWRGRYRGA